MTIESDTRVSLKSKKERVESTFEFNVNCTQTLPLLSFCFLLLFLDGLVDEVLLVVVHMVVVVVVLLIYYYYLCLFFLRVCFFSFSD